ncbi:DUF2442 domain-containing protein [Candidatus Magnetomoraceae bacterium gMMP-15]
MIRIIRAFPLPNYCLKLKFNTGEEKILDMKEILKSPIFSKLLDPEIFSHVSIDEVAGTVVWPGGIDLCPETVYEQSELIDK